jgi:hypothetical protein
MDPLAPHRSDAFEWNRGGWFGSQIGATLWLILLGTFLLARSEPIGALVLSAGWVPNFVGLWLWRSRASIRPYPAIQMLLATCGLCAGVALLGLRAVGVAESSSDAIPLWLLALYPGLMLVFHLREHGIARPPGSRGCGE